MIKHKAMITLVAMTIALVMGATMTGVVSAVDGEVSWNPAPSPVYVWSETFTVSGTINAPVPGGADAYVFAIGTDSQLHRITDKVAVSSGGAFSKSVDISSVLQPTNTWNGGDVQLVIGYFSESSWHQWGSSLSVHIIGPSEFSLTGPSTVAAGHDLTLSGTIKYDGNQQVPATDVRVDIYQWPTSTVMEFVGTTRAAAGTGAYSLTIPAVTLTVRPYLFAAFITDSQGHIKSKSNELRVTVQQEQGVSSFITIDSAEGHGESYAYNGIPFEVYHATVEQPVLSTKVNDPAPESVDLSRYGLVTRIHMLQAAGDSVEFGNGVVAGTVTVYNKDGTSIALPLTLGSNTAEWAYDRPNLDVAHTRVDPAYSWLTTAGSTEQYNGHYYYTSIDVGGKTVDHIAITPLQAKPIANVFALTLEKSNAQAHAVTTATALINDNAVAFDKSTSHTPFDNKLAEVMGYINTGDYATALTKVQRDLMPKADGNARPADWVSATSQPRVYQQLQWIESDLLSLQSVGIAR